MHKLISKAFCHFIKNKAKRKYVYHVLMNKVKVLENTGGGIIAKHYDIKGENNKIIIVENGVERLLYPNEMIKGLNIIINGNNNVVKLELPMKAENSIIQIGNDNTEVVICASALLCGLYIRCCYGYGQKVKIGQNFIVWGGELKLDGESALFIGDDCLFSNNIFIWADDGHAVLDAETGEILNKPTGALTIGNHCWIGQGVRMTKNARIGNNCIVGGGAVAVKDYKEDNVVIAGNPAKIIKRNITWDRANAYHLEQARKQPQ